MANKTHYDNLQVPRDASTEAIRAAYRELVQQYAANQSPSAEANRRMKTVHNSYSILSNPIQKNKYDQWLLEQEPARAQLQKTGSDAPAPTPAEKPGRSGHAPVLKLVTDRADPAFEPEEPAGRGNWPYYAGAGLLVAIAVAWLAFSGEQPVADATPASLADATTSQEGTLVPTTGAVIDKAGPASTSIMPEGTPIEDIPARVSANVEQFIGSWQGTGDSGNLRQALAIKPKSGNSFAFRLDSKAGTSIGGITGVAVLENGQARFFSREYGCSIVFSPGAGGLRLETRNCRAFYRNNAVFDGTYMRPENIKAAPAKTTAERAPALVAEPAPAPAAEVAAVAVPAPVKAGPRLRKYEVTVQDASGNISTLELLAKDKSAARKIVRDFRGDPKVLKVKELRN